MVEFYAINLNIYPTGTTPNCDYLGIEWTLCLFGWKTLYSPWYFWVENIILSLILDLPLFIRLIAPWQDAAPVMGVERNCSCSSNGNILMLRCLSFFYARVIRILILGKLVFVILTLRICQQAAAYYYHGLVLGKGSAPSDHVSAVCCLFAAEELLREGKRACLSFCLAAPVTRSLFTI